MQVDLTTKLLYNLSIDKANIVGIPYMDKSI